jgi:regulator of protease activity HflC (stomatin/prohibitin superfamily)
VEFVIVLAAIVVILFVYVAAGVRIVRPYERGIVERLGKFKETADPGLRIIVPFVDKMTVVDMREQVVDVPPQEVITKDNVVVSVDAVVYHEATDAQRLVYNIANFMLAVTRLAQTNLRNVVGDMQLDDALTSRDMINHRLRDILDDATDKWGVRVVRVEIQRIDPPPDVMTSMHEQMRAERQRRAVVLEAQGAREAAITRAEGLKAAQVLEADGQAEAIRLVADAERFRVLTEAEGEADAIRSVFRAIHDGDPTPDLLAVRYLETLQLMADGQATKLIVPVELSGLVGAVSAVTEALAVGSAPGAGDEATSPPPPPPPAPAR